MTREQIAGGERTATLPHLSHSRINRYLHCPEQYRLYYVENLRPRVAPAHMVFGKIVHEALAALFQRRVDPVRRFSEAWGQLRDVELTYRERDSWEKLADGGAALLEKFVTEDAKRIPEVEAVEESFTLTVTSLAAPFVGVIDLMAQLDGKRTVIDFKTATSDYEEHTVVLSDQLTAYTLAKPKAEQVALCVLIRTKAPRIEWHISRRKPVQLVEYFRKVTIVAGAITGRHFYKRPGWWCGGCDYLPVCLGDQSNVRETLIQVASSNAS